MMKKNNLLLLLLIILLNSCKNDDVPLVERLIISNSNNEFIILEKDFKIKNTDFSFVEYVNDFYICRNSNNKYGILSSSLDTIVPFRFDAIQNCEDSIFYAKSELNPNLLIINKLDYKEIHNVDFVELWKNYNKIIIKRNNEYGLIDFDGKILGKLEYDNIISNIVYPFSGAINFKYALALKNDSVCYLDSNGNVLNNQYYDLAMPFIGTYAYVLKNNLWGVINEKGEFLIKPKYQIIGYIGRHRNQILKNNQSNRFVFDYLQEINSDISHIRVKYNDKFGYVNLMDDVVVPINYIYADMFSSKLAAVKKNNKYGFINHNNELVIDFKFDYAESFSYDVAIVSKDSKYFLINHKGERISEEFEYIMTISDGVNFRIPIFKCQKDSKNINKYYIVDTLGKIILSDSFDKIKLTSNPNLISLKKDNINFIYVVNQSKLINILDYDIDNIVENFVILKKNNAQTTKYKVYDIKKFNYLTSREYLFVATYKNYFVMKNDNFIEIFDKNGIFIKSIKV